MKVAFCVTDSHIDYVITTIEAICTYHSTVKVAILSSDLSDVSRKKLNRLPIEELRLYTELDRGKVEKLPMTMHHITLETYFRYFLPELLSDWDKVLYLDSDLLIAGDLTEFWETDLSDAYLAGVSELDIIRHYAAYKKSIGFELDELYVNAGVLLMNLEAMRRDNITNLLFAETERLTGQIQFQDQDVINIALKGKIVEVPLRYNYTAEAMRQNRLPIEEVAIFHYNSAHIKPWIKWDKNWESPVGEIISLWRNNYKEVMKAYGGVSVIVAFRNQEETLGHTLSALVNQAFHNIEIILVDANSDDQSSAICQTFAQRDSRIQYHYQAATSLNQARERGLRAASRPYILFVEEGDFVFDEGIAVLYKLAESTESDVLVGAFARFRSGRFQFLPYPPYRLARKSLSTIANEMQASNARHLFYTKVWGNLYRRNILMGLRFTGDDQQQETFVWGALQRAQNIYVLNQQVYVCRVKE
ncbi:glycosyltransferase family 8 protein [Streptococcus suis]|uniref:glycosyltransferase family 8 protein n=1 Tax=Streptococcus suis TaxID=1307 RepID=UPI00375811F5